MSFDKDLLHKKDLKNCERSRNVYENKQNMDMMPDDKSDIYVESTPVLQKTEVL